MAYIYGQENILEGKGETVKEQLAINLHYFDYQIGINRKNIDNRLGIKLGEDEVTILERFAPKDSSKPTDNLLLFPITSDDNLVQDNLANLLESDEINVLIEALMKATDCSLSQLLCSQFFEMTNKDGQSQLYIKTGKKKRELPSTLDPDLIITAVSKLRKSTSQDLLKLSPSEIDA